MPRSGAGRHLYHYIKSGQCGRALMPQSEVCMSMKVAGTYRDFLLLLSGKTMMVQLYEEAESGGDRFQRKFSFPITLGEAGLFGNVNFLYYYPHGMRSEDDPLASHAPVSFAELDSTDTK